MLENKEVHHIVLFDVLNFTINSHEDYLNSGYVPTYASPQWISSLKENSVKK